MFCLDPAAREAGNALYDGELYFRNSRPGSREMGANHGYRDYLADQAEIAAKFSDVLARIEQMVPAGVLVDIGAGPGFLLASAQRRGWTATGVDVNPWAAQYAREVLGVEAQAATVAINPSVLPLTSHLLPLRCLSHVPSSPGRLGRWPRRA